MYSTNLFVMLRLVKIHGTESRTVYRGEGRGNTESEYLMNMELFGGQTKKKMFWNDDGNVNFTKCEMYIMSLNCTSYK